MNTVDSFDLKRFVSAQRSDFATALQELRQGLKQSHWIWYIFPQVAGLGRSPMSERYAIRSAAEARAYLEHGVLGPRLKECAAAVLAHTDKDVSDIMGHPDDLKLKSSMTLFAAVSPPGSVFEQVLESFYAGQRDPATLLFLG